MSELGQINCKALSTYPNKKIPYSKKMRLIEDHEVALSILHNNLEVYCNPSCLMETQFSNNTTRHVDTTSQLPISQDVSFY